MPAPQDFEKMIRELKARVIKLEQARPLSNTGLSCPEPGITQVNGQLDVTGSIDVGGTANFDGDTTIGGSAAITGTLSLPAGIIDNAALANPVVPQVSNFQNTNFAVTTSNTEVAGANVIVPDDCSRLLAHVSAHVYATNPNTTGGSDGTGSDALWCLASVGGVDGPRLGGPLSGSYGYTTSDGSVATLLTGLTPGSAIRIAAKAASAFQNFGADPVNTAYVTASLIWLR